MSRRGLGRGSGSGPDHRLADSLFFSQPSRTSRVVDRVGFFTRRAAGGGNAAHALVGLAATSATTGWLGTNPFVVLVGVASVAACGPRDVWVHGQLDPHKRYGDVGGGFGGGESQ